MRQVGKLGLGELNPLTRDPVLIGVGEGELPVAQLYGFSFHLQDFFSCLFCIWDARNINVHFSRGLCTIIEDNWFFLNITEMMDVFLSVLLKVKARHIWTQRSILETISYGGALTISVQAKDQRSFSTLSKPPPSPKAQQRESTEGFGWINEHMTISLGFVRMLSFLRKDFYLTLIFPSSPWLEFMSSWP